jgi:hypothetical protein
MVMHGFSSFGHAHKILDDARDITGDRDIIASGDSMQ